MVEQRVTRRTALKAGAGVGLLTALTGCLDGGSPTGNGDGPGGGSGSIDAVPSSATAVVSLDTGRLLDGELVRRSFNRALELVQQQQRSIPMPVESYEQALSMAESEIGLEPTGLQSVTFFTGAMGSATGVLFSADWGEDALVSAIEDQQGMTLTGRSDGGHTIYSSEDGDDGLVALADGRYLLAKRTTIDSVIAVLAGEADPVGGALADAYAGTSGMVRFAVDVPDDYYSGDDQLSAMADVDMLSGSLSGSGDTRTLSVSMSTDGSGSAEDLATQIDSVVTLASSQLDQYPEVEQYIENPEQHLDSIDVAQSGSTVTVTYGGSVELVAEGGMLILAAVVASFVLGVGESTGSTYPTASFNWDYYREGTVTITHVSGESIDGANLYVRGSTGNGTVDRSWAEYGANEVTAGTSVTVENVSDSYDLMVVWDDESGGSSAVLSGDAGPDA